MLFLLYHLIIATCSYNERIISKIANSDIFYNVGFALDKSFFSIGDQLKEVCIQYQKVNKLREKYISYLNGLNEKDFSDIENLNIEKNLPFNNFYFDIAKKPFFDEYKFIKSSEINTKYIIDEEKSIKGFTVLAYTQENSMNKYCVAIPLKETDNFAFFTLDEFPTEECLNFYVNVYQPSFFQHFITI